MVGCVIARGDRVIGEGYHEQFGGPHAEPNALANCVEPPQGATAYVTLEPCCHTNKKTPPCVPKLIEAKLTRVVIGCLDPNPQVNGQGAAKLRTAGIQVDGPLLEAEAKQLNAAFFARAIHRRPYITLKWAESTNGKMAGHLGRPVHITNPTADRKVHELRARCDAIAVGTNTVRNDDPLLTARDVPILRRLLRVVLSNRLTVAPASRLVKTAKEYPLLIFCSHQAAQEHARQVDELRQAGAEIVALPDTGPERFAFPDVLSELHARSVTHLLVEPGPTLAKSLIARGQVDRVWVFRSPVPLADEDGLAAAQVPYPATSESDLDGDQLMEYLNPDSPVFFAAVPSADFVLAMESR